MGMDANRLTASYAPITSDFSAESWRRLKHEIKRVMMLTGAALPERDPLGVVAALLPMAPVGSASLTTATTRLQAARRFLESNERGAARYELHLLEQWIDSFVDDTSPWQSGN
jgi:hypothetical protein